MEAVSTHDGWQQVAGPTGMYSGGRFFTHRFRVPGGWLYRCSYIAENETEPEQVTVTFVPEPEAET